MKKHILSALFFVLFIILVYSIMEMPTMQTMMRHPIMMPQNIT